MKLISHHHVHLTQIDINSSTRRGVLGPVEPVSSPSPSPQKQSQVTITRQAGSRRGCIESGVNYMRMKKLIAQQACMHCIPIPSLHSLFFFFLSLFCLLIQLHFRLRTPLPSIASYFVLNVPLSLRPALLVVIGR